MKSIFLAFIVVTWTAATVQGESPPRANYYQSAYEDLAYQEEAPSLYPTEEPHPHSHAREQGHSYAHGHSHGHAHAHAPAHSHGPVQHEVIVQHHHYPPPAHTSRVISHGTPEPTYQAHSQLKTRGHYHAHSHAAPVKTSAAYHSPKTEAVESPGLYAGYSSVKANDYKAYSMHTPSAQTDDYGIEAYSPVHSADYGTPNTYHNLPSYKGAALSYAPPGDYALTQSPALASYNTDYPESHYQRPKAKGHRTSSAHSHSSYSTGVKTPSYSKTLASYAAPKAVTYPNAYVNQPKYTTLAYATKPSYASTKPVGYSIGSGLQKMKTYFRQPSKSYGTASQYSNYASASPSYSYGSPASKGMSYTYSQQADKGYVRFADESYGAPASRYTEDDSSTLVAQGADETENYGGGYDAGTAHY